MRNGELKRYAQIWHFLSVLCVLASLRELFLKRSSRGDAEIAKYAERAGGVSVATTVLEKGGMVIILCYSTG